jgi:hypothetical protein
MKGSIMSYNYQDYLMTPEEFAEMVISIMHEQNCFDRSRDYHPEDIEAAFSQIAYAVAKGISHLSIRNNARDRNMIVGSENGMDCQ